MSRTVKTYIHLGDSNCVQFHLLHLYIGGLLLHAAAVDISGTEKILGHLTRSLVVGEYRNLLDIDPMQMLTDHGSFLMDCGRENSGGMSS